MNQELHLVPVSFSWEPDANETKTNIQEVLITGSWNEFKPVKLQQNGNKWSTELSMPPGRYKYSFTVDGQVKHVTNLPFTVDPATGTIYNIINVSMTSLGSQGLAPNRLKLLEGEEFSQFEPLTVRITNILRQYPDGSQILKELLQNADDARATHVKFVFDRRSFPSKKLFTDGMKLFQGPALYAYNSGVFEEKDFESIRRLGSSRKKNELGKTGRFGIGFNSIYHITDLPSFVSGKHLVMLDPHARYLPGETQSCGKRWDYLECPEVTTIFEDQVAPYKMLNCDMKSFLNGTIFRFPLRTDEVSPFSQISKLPYTEEKVEELFASFKKEGSTVLLFLKFVESVELYTWDKDDAEPKHYYSVVIKNAEKQNPITMNTVRTDRKVMYDSVSQGLSYLETMAGKEKSYVIPLDVEVKDGTQINHESWMLCNQIGGGKSSEMAMQEFKAAQGLRLVPWGGVATKSIFTKENVKGRVFCFLPLPTETGLPVHVNGCFELSLNRRDVWHGEDLSGEGKKKVDWNNRLKQDVVGSAYAALIEQTALSIAKNNQLEYLIQFYEQWPNIKSTNSYWNDLSESVYSYLIKNQAKVLYSPSNGGRWVSASEAVFVYRNEDVHSTAVPPAVFKTVVQALIDENIPVVEVTPGLFEAFSHALGNTVKFVSPSLVRSILKTNWVTVPAMYQKNRSLVVHLLEYCLADRNFKDLQGINLVPMADKSFSKFESKNKAQIYLATDLEMSLFPNHLSMFVDSNIVSPTINAELKSAELREVVNVTIVDPKTVSQLFEHVLPKEWKNSYLVEWKQSIVSKDWLERFWQYLTFLTMNGNDKPETDFEQWPLVPCMGQRLCSLHPNTPCLLSHSSLSNDVITALAKLHCYVVDETEITLNNKILSNIFPAGDAAGVLNALTQCIKNSNKSPIELFTVLSDDEKIALKRFFSKYEWFENKVLTSAVQRDNLKQLPIFETFSKERRFAAIDKTQYACPPENIPHDITSEYLLKRDSPHDKYLLEFLEISVLKRPEFYKSYLTEKLSSFTQEHRDQVMLYVLEDLNAIIKEDTAGDVVDFLRNLEFIPDSNGRLCPPRYLFDPEETDMNHMFTFEPVFPTGPYKDPAMLASLRKLGLKKQLGVKDFIDRIKSVPSYYKQDKQAALLRAKSLCAYLDRNFSMLEPELSAEDFDVFTKELSATEWLPSISPEHFVSNYMSLNSVANDALSAFNQAFWFVGEPRLVAPNVTCLQRDALLSCGSRAILDYHPKNPYFIKTFDWINPPKVEVVVSHTKKLASTASSFNIEGESGSKLSSFITTISDRVNEYLNNALSTGQITKIAFDELLDEDCKWIWVAPYFAKKTQIVRELSTDLSPFIFSCPRELKKYPNLYSTLNFKDYVEPEDLVGILKDLLALRVNNKTPLNERELKLCLSAVTLLSENIESVKDIPNGLVLPSLNGYLISPSKLVYDDMPWVKSLEAKTPENHQIIHPLIPNQIAKTLGIRPCSLVIITNAIDPIKDQDGDASVYKKLGKISEALHTRPQARILTEMIQNADDAGANEFVVILDDTQHKDNSLFGPKMKEHQGPALYIYNNSTFRPEDFENICTPGRSAKRGDITKIGKLGIGFSTLFHLSDLPSFVSGNYVVFCDAYTSHVPGSNSHHPYVRFNLNSNIVSLFPDQFSTFNFMGCDVTKGYFPGTLFRIPLRQVLKGKESRLPGSIVSVDKVRKLIGRFMGQATSHLAFLNRVKKIDTYQNDEKSLKPWFTAEIENFTPELEKFRGKPKDIASYIDTQLSTLDDNDEEDLTVEDPNNNNNTNEPDSGDKQKRPKKKKRAVKKIVAVNPIKRRLDVPLELQRETQMVNMKVTKRAEGESTSERWLMSQYFDASYVNKILTSKTKISGLRLPYSIVAARLPADTKELDQQEYTKKKKAEDKEEKETTSGKLFYYVPLDIATGLPVQIHSNFDLTPEKSGLITTEEAEWNRVLRDTSVLGAYVHFIKGLQACIARGEVKKNQYYDFWPSTTSPVDQFWHPMIQSFYQLLAKQTCLFSFMDENTLIAPFESVFPNELILHKNTAKLVDILKQIKFPLADAPEVIYQQFKYHSVNEIQQLSPIKLRNFLKKMAAETGKTYWTYDEFVISSRESALVLLNYCLESSKVETVLPTIEDDTDFKRKTSKNQKLKLQKAKKRQNWDSSQLDEEETLAIIQGLIGLPLCCLHNNAITIFGGPLKYMIDTDINTIVELIESLPAFKRTLIHIDVSKIMRDFKLSRKADLSPASITNFGVAELMENFHLILPKDWRGREEINWDFNDISEAWLRKFWSVAKGKWSALPTDWPIIPTEDYKLVSRGRAEYIFVPPGELEVVRGPKLRLFDIMTKLQALFLNTDICPPTNETRKMCLSIKPEDILLALRRVKPENCDNLTSQDRSFLLETLSTGVSIDRIAMEAKILKRLPLFETESETNPDYLVNLCADVICDHPKLFKNIPPELREQLEEYGKTRFVAPQDEYFMMPPDVPSTSLNSKFLKFKPKLQQLYTCLGISAANRGHFLKKYVLPNYQTLSPQNQIKMLEFIKNNMVTLKNEIKHFDDLMSVFEFIPTRAGVARRGVFLYDPTNAVFAFEFSDVPENFPDLRISSKEWVSFLRDNFGLNTTLSEEHLLSAALKYSALPSLSAPQLRRLIELIQLCYQTHESKGFNDIKMLKTFNIEDSLKVYESLTDDVVASNRKKQRNKEANRKTQRDAEAAFKVFVYSFVNKAKNIQFVPCMWDPRLTNAADDDAMDPSNIVLQRFDDVALPEYRSIIWTVSPFFHPEIVPNEVVRAVWSLEPPKITKVIQHIKNLMEQGDRFKYKSIKHLQKDLKAAFKYIAERLEEAKKVPKSKEYEDTVGIIREQLGTIACVVVDESGLAVLPHQLFFKFHKSNSQDGNETSSNVATDFRPFFYRVPRKLSKFEELFKVAGAKVVPDIDQILDVLTQLADKKKNTPLNPNQLDLAIRILRYCSQLRVLQPENHDRYFAASVPVILAPDTHSKLKPCSELIYDDSSWLHHRINIAEFSLAHHHVTQFIASQMHIQSLSEIVEEIFNPEVKIQPVNLTEAAKFTAVISAPQFCEGLLRISMHELTRRKSEKLDVAREVKRLEQKVMQLQQFKVVIVPTIHSQFIDKRTKRNVTKDETGTNCLLDERTKTIFLIEKLPKAVKYEELLVIEINRYLGHFLRNLLPLQSILTCDPSDILSVLNHYKIDQKGAGTFINGMTNKSYGTPLTSEQMQSLTFSPLLPLTVDETVAWKNKADDKFYYGVIKSIESEDREFLTDVTLESNDVTLTVSSIYVYKFVDEMHPEAPIQLVPKMLEKLLKEIEVLDERHDNHVPDIQRELVLRVRERWAHSSEITSLVKKVEFALDM